jgi:uncharacterized protein YbjT (DUF2867 family)
MILVTGALGFVGRHLVGRLADEGHRVRVLIPNRWHRRLPWDSPQIEVFGGTIFDPEALYRAMSGVHTVFHLAGSQWWGSARDLENIDLAGTKNVITAGRSARVGRIITLSHIGSEPSSGFHLLRTKGQVEALVRSSGIAYTIFRTGVLFGQEDHFVNHIALILRSNPFVVFQPGNGEALLNPLHIDDLTSALIRALEVLDLVDETVEIGGAEYMTYNELLRTVMRVSRCKRTIFPIPPYMMRTFSNLWRLVPLRWPTTVQWSDILAGNRTAPLGNLYNYTGVRPRRFEDTLLTYMPGRWYSIGLLRFLFSRRKHGAF